MTRSDRLNRREFLSRAGAALAVPYVVSSSALGGGGGVAASERIVMGCIGVGSRGGGNMRSFLGRDVTQLVAVCDVDKGRRDGAKGTIDKKYGNSDCKTYEDFRELIARDDIDALSLALPDQWHSIPAIMGAKAGKDMYAEKPLARTIYEGRAMVNAVTKAGAVWQTGSQQRSTANFHRACELVRNGRIGKVMRVDVGLPTGKSSKTLPVQTPPGGLDWDMWLGPAPWRPCMDLGRGGPHWNWRWIRDFSGGQLTDWAGHHIDIAKWGLGLERTGPVEVHGEGEYPKDGTYDVPMTYKFTCTYANGVVLTVANNKQIPQGATWYGEKGKVYVNRGKLESDPKEVLNETIGPDEIRLYNSRDHQGNFLDCVKTRKETVAPIEIGHRSISVGLLGEIAMLTGQKLQWDPEKEVFGNSDEANRMLKRPMRAPWRI